MISDFGVESVEYHAGAKYAELLDEDERVGHRGAVGANTFDMVRGTFHVIDRQLRVVGQRSALQLRTSLFGNWNPFTASPFGVRE